MLKKKRHDQRTITVLTRVSESELHVTYCNALVDDEPYILTVILGGPPFTVPPEQLPAVGATKTVWNDKGNR